ncbi:MAG: carboxy-S-adenosyl-L-methionine synthase CmoA [Candidatus Nitrohelix vancouverensis]|uniref:Carboxy-S-adenosyl-L-methionine synthase n=1 Tax=Candidatus Nitrohelix vancouverensis TaxID=2705534 RepID=A0A7T0G4B6_9BACT|nr:MAG: carboxy-S-adenosyl-L-methionine synthase CmoA [Candidatus Nitrohelix vancouverensis]
MKDDLFTRATPEKFQFNEAVARVFDDMLERSVPLYRECLTMTAEWCRALAKPHSRIYDLGCSTGTLLDLLSQTGALPPSVELIGVDNSRPMIERAQKKLSAQARSFQFIEADLSQPFALENASVAILNYTLQFIPPDTRLKLLSQICTGLLPGGGLAIIEKIKGETAEMDAHFIAMHHEYKRRRGYSELEISAKRDALENVLIPWTLTENLAVLKKAGFSQIDVFFKWNNFTGLIALK